MNVDTILQNVVHDAAELSFSVPQDDVPATRRALADAQEAIGTIEVEEISDLGKVSLVGAGMRSHPGVAARMFRTLADEEHQPPPHLDVADQGVLPHPARGRRARRARAARGVLTRRAVVSGRRDEQRDRRARGERRPADGAVVARPPSGSSSSSPGLLLLLSSFAVWINRVALNTGTFTDTSSSLLDNDEIRSAVANRAVDELFANVDVQAEVEEQLPTDYKGLSGAATAGLRQASYQIVDRALEQPVFQELFRRRARGVAHDARRRCSRAAATGSRPTRAR